MLSGYTYEEVIALLFIYAEPAILTFTAAMPMALMIYKLWRQRTPKRFSVTAAAVLWFLPFAFTMLNIWQRYGLPLQEACEKAYVDLKWMGEASGLGYEAVNMLLFIVVFLFLFLLNVFFYTLLRNMMLDLPKVKRRKRTRK